MILELKPEHAKILEMATQSGMSKEEVLDEAFAFIHSQQEMNLWLLEHQQEVTAQIEEGFAQAERGELVDAEEVKRILREDRAGQKIA